MSHGAQKAAAASGTAKSSGMTPITRQSRPFHVDGAINDLRIGAQVLPEAITQNDDRVRRWTPVAT